MSATPENPSSITSIDAKKKNSNSSSTVAKNNSAKLADTKKKTTGRRSSHPRKTATPVAIDALESFAPSRLVSQDKTSSSQKSSFDAAQARALSAFSMAEIMRAQRQLDPKQRRVMSKVTGLHPQKPMESKPVLSTNMQNRSSAVSKSSSSNVKELDDKIDSKTTREDESEQKSPQRTVKRHQPSLKDQQETESAEYIGSELIIKEKSVLNNDIHDKLNEDADNSTNSNSQTVVNISADENDSAPKPKRKYTRRKKSADKNQEKSTVTPKSTSKKSVHVEQVISESSNTDSNATDSVTKEKPVKSRTKRTYTRSKKTPEKTADLSVLPSTSTSDEVNNNVQLNRVLTTDENGTDEQLENDYQTKRETSKSDNSTSLSENKELEQKQSLLVVLPLEGTSSLPDSNESHELTSKASKSNSYVENSGEEIQASLSDLDNECEAETVQQDAMQVAKKARRRTRKVNEVSNPDSKHQDEKSGDLLTSDKLEEPVSVVPQLDSHKDDDSTDESEASYKNREEKDGSDAEKDSLNDSGHSEKRPHVKRRKSHDATDESRTHHERTNKRRQLNEPSLSHEDAAAMKVVDLRKKAKDLGVDVKGNFHIFRTAYNTHPTTATAGTCLDNNRITAYFSKFFCFFNI